MPIQATVQHGIAAALLVSIAAANYRSVKLGAAIQNVSTSAKVLAIVGLSAAIFAFAPGGRANPLRADGCGELVRHRPDRRALGLRRLGGPDHAVRRAGASLAGALVTLSVFGTLNGSILSSPRVFFAMAEDGLCFRTVGRVHPRLENPYVAIGFSAVLAVIYVLLRDFMRLAEGCMLGVWPFLALCVIGLFVLRRRRPDFPRTYRALGYPMVPALFVLATLAVTANAPCAQSWSTTISILITVAGLPTPPLDGMATTPADHRGVIA